MPHSSDAARQRLLCKQLFPNATTMLTLTAADQLPAIRDAENAVAAQAKVRAVVGIPVILAGLLALLHIGVPADLVGPIAFIHFSYIVVMLFLAARSRPFSAEQLAAGTAVLDPLMLSAWLPMMGEVGALFVGFYLFTILGFGFRTGTRLMLICQVTSIVGFTAVLLIESSFWPRHQVIWFSFLIALILVPLYAGILIRKLHEARAHAERESHAKSQLLAKVSHELRTPLTGIVAAAQLLAAEAEDTRAASRSETIMGLSRDLLREINDLLDQAKYEAKALVLDSTLYDLRDQVERLRLVLEPTAAKKNLMFVVDIDPRIKDRVQGDSHYLGKVLLNLTGNAIKFTDQGRVNVAVTLLEEKEDLYRIRFSVQDTGIGIPKELHDKIFEPFFQADAGTARKYGGTGLGTTIAKEIVNLMGGQILVASSPGAGSHFHFDLDLQRVKSRQKTATAGVAATVYGKRILVVDDNTTILTLIREMLLRDRHEVLTARSGSEALEVLSSRDVDVIFLDFNMGDMDGAKVLQLYRFGRLKTAPTFFLTADATAATAARLGSAGAAGVLHKPITADDLRRAIAQVCDNISDQTAKLDGALTRTVPPVAVPAQAPLATIPTQYIDHTVRDGLRSMSERPEFLADVVSSALSDIERNTQALLQALNSQDSESVRDRAHALKGVCASIGATRLETLANRLMRVTTEELTQSGSPRLRTDVSETSRHSVAALRNALPDKAVNG